MSDTETIPANPLRQIRSDAHVRVELMAVTLGLSAKTLWNWEHMEEPKPHMVLAYTAATEAISKSGWIYADGIAPAGVGAGERVGRGVPAPVDPQNRPLTAALQPTKAA